MRELLFYCLAHARISTYTVRPPSLRDGVRKSNQSITLLRSIPLDDAALFRVKLKTHPSVKVLLGSTTGTGTLRDVVNLEPVLTGSRDAVPPLERQLQAHLERWAWTLMASIVLLLALNTEASINLSPILELPQMPENSSFVTPP